VTGYLSSEATWRGQFWLPGQSGHDDQEGILTYKPESGITLSLTRGFDDGGTTRLTPNTFAFREGPGRFPLIHGIAGSTPVTLLDCLVTRSTRGMLSSQVNEQEIRAGQLLLGVLLNDPETPAFGGVSIELENLTVWDRRQDVMLRTEVHPDLPGGSRWAVEVNQAPPLTSTVEDLTIELRRRYVEPSGDAQRHGIDTSTFAASYFTITSSEPKSLSEWDAIAKILQDFLTFAMDSACAVLRETLTPSEALQNDEGAQARSAITSFAQQIIVGKPDAPSIETRKALFTLGTEGVEFETLVPRWWEVHSQFNVTCDMILGLQYVRGGYLQTDLITAVGAAEALHEGLDFGPPMPKSEFKALKTALLEQVPEKHKTWLREKLGHNTRTLRTKLLDLAKTPDPEVMAVVLPNLDAWADATKKERDPVAHGGKNMSSDVKLLSAIVKTTTAVVLLNILHQLHIPKERLMFAAYDNPTLASAAKLAKEQWPTDDGAE
jgi:hypothetical protein